MSSFLKQLLSNFALSYINVSRNLCSASIISNVSSCDAQILNNVQFQDPKTVENDDVIYGKKNETISVLQEQKILEDVSHVSPPTPISFNFAAYANKCEVLQRLIDLGIDFYAIEQKPDLPDYLLLLDFEKDVKPYINFLVDKGVPADNLGEFFTKNPFFFRNELNDLQIRINYLQSKKFLPEMIAQVIMKSPKWLNFSTKVVDRRLGMLQEHFLLTGAEVRRLITQYSRIIEVNEKRLLPLIFMFKDVEGFTLEQYKNILLKQPFIFRQSVIYIKPKLEFMLFEMKIPHEMIAREPYIFVNRLGRIKERHLFLESLGRNQYDPKKPNFVSLKALTHGADTLFCQTIAKTPIELYNKFLKTL